LSLVGFEDYPLYYRKNSVTNAKAMGNVVEFESQMIMPYEIESPDEMVIEEETQNQSSTDKVISEQQSSVRENFNETAFFYPQIETADDGSATFGFTMPDALTRWNLMMLAYTKDLKAGQKQYSFTTSKPLMIMADMPRFCYENDTMWIVANVINTGDESCSPKAKLEIFDAETMRPLDLILSDQTIDLGKIQKARSKSARWKVGFAEDVSLLAFRFSANAKGFTDAEQHMMPVFSNEIFQVQTVPVTVKGQSLMALPLDFLDIENSNERNYSFTFNFSSNPVWYAVQALPYLAEANDQYVETSFYQFYANTLAAHVANSIPELDRYLEKWRSESVNALQSQINMNQDLKAIMAKETPWVLEAKNEAEQKANIAKLLDLNALRYQQKQSLSFLRKKQKNSGGWPWIEGMPESPNVTSYILSGLGKLTSIDAVSSLSQECQNMVQNIVCGAVSYLRQELTNDYRELKDSKMRKNYRVSPNVLDMLYALSYFPQINSTDKYESIERFYLKHLAEQWIDFSFEYQAKAALVLSRKENQSASTLIMQSLKERARNKDDIGMYWTSNNHFGNSNVAVQATIMEAFDEILDDSENMNQMRLWLLTQKRTTQWENNRATAEAIYALLLRGEDWLRDTDDITVKIGNEIINTKGDAGTGFYQRRWNASEITSDFDSVFVENPTNHMEWGGLFRQYFVPIDEVKKASSPLSIKRELFVEKVCEDGPRLVPVEGQTLKVGDKLTVQLTFISAQDMEFVFVKDLRAAGLEPVNHVSGYHYNDGVGYYQSATDGFMGFHIDYLPKGTHKVSYSMYVNKEGDFSNGYALIQSLYAPEFSAYSDGMRIKVGK
jgi:Large extracellular alpha-helical protein